MLLRGKCEYLDTCCIYGCTGECVCVFSRYACLFVHWILFDISDNKPMPLAMVVAMSWTELVTAFYIFHLFSPANNYKWSIIWILQRAREKEILSENGCVHQKQSSNTTFKCAFSSIIFNELAWNSRTRFRLSSVHDKLLSSNSDFRQQRSDRQFLIDAPWINHLYNYCSLIIHIKNSYFKTATSKSHTERERERERECRICVRKRNVFSRCLE